jgi:4-hydroxy-4-methyl-2-oxoglutarate aldolase
MMQPASFAERLRACYTGAIHDVLRAKGHSKQTLPHFIRPLNLSHKLAGPVFTIEGRRDDTLDAHQSLLKWCELLSKAPANVVLICQPNDHTLAHMGELSSETLACKKVLGYIVDGGCRDSAFIEKQASRYSAATTRRWISSENGPQLLSSILLESVMSPFILETTC